MQRGRGGQEHHQRHHHAIAHHHVLCGADQDAVIDKGGHEGEGAKRGNRQIGQRLGPHGLIGGHQADDPRPGAIPERAQPQRDHQPPDHRETIGLLIGRPPIGAHRLAGQLLGGLGNAIEEEPHHHQQVEQHRIGGERYFAHARSLRGEPGIGAHQCHGADHQVAAEAEHALDGMGVAQLARRDSGNQNSYAAIMPDEDDKAQYRRHDLSQQRPGRRAGDAPAQPIDQADAAHDVDAMQHQLQQHAGARRRPAIEPAQKRIVDQ
ncbi:hypothetical protein D3C87_1475770 [compost metagenome]